MKTKAIPPSKLTCWLLASRPKTLIASFSPVVIGAKLAPVFDGILFLATFLFALCIQIGTNLANDYYDFQKGADTAARKGPIRLTQAGLISSSSMKLGFIVSFFFASIMGGYLIFAGGGILMLIALFVSILFGVFYTATRFSIAYLGLAEIFVITFFGSIACWGSYFLQTKTLALTPFLVGLGPGFLSCAILVVNNLRDYEEDLQAKKRTLIVRFGLSFGWKEYTCFLFAAPLVPLLLASFGYLNSQHLFFLFFYGPSFLVWRHFQKYKDFHKALENTAKLLFLYTASFFLLQSL